MWRDHSGRAGRRGDLIHPDGGHRVPPRPGIAGNESGGARDGEIMAEPTTTVVSRRDLLKLGGMSIVAHAALPVLGRDAAEAQTPKRGGVFRIRGEDATTGFDPHLSTNHHRIATNLSFTHSRLVKVRAGASVVPGPLPTQPGLAEPWIPSSCPSYVFKLRK